MVLKVDQAGVINNRFTFRDGETIVARMSVDLLTGDADAELDGRKYSLFRRGFFRIAYECRSDESLLYRARRVGWVRPVFWISSEQYGYDLRRSSLKIELFEGKRCVGRILRDAVGEFPGTVTGFERLPGALWLFGFWISLRFWGPKESS